MHYQRIIVALTQTPRIMNEIDGPTQNTLKRICSVRFQFFYALFRAFMWLS